MARSKFINRNVPETFYERFLKGKPQTTSLLQKLAGITPTRRARGYTRVIELCTEAEWEELYAYAAEGRAAMQGADRETTLRPAICARALCESMESQGVANPVPYITKRKTATPVIEEPVTTDEVDTDLTPHVPQTPPTVDQVADVEEATDADLDSIHDDLAIG